MITKATLISTMKKARQQQDTRNEAKFVKQVSGKGLSTNDYTTDEKTKLSGVANGAQVNVLESVELDGTAQTIKNKKVTLDLSNYAKKTDISTVLNYKGTVAKFSALPTADLTTGDVYNVTAAGGTDANGTAIKAGDNVVYNGKGWDNLGGTVDLSGYVQKVSGKGLSTNDFTDEEKAQLAALEASKDETVSDEDIASIFADDTTTA